jgi:DNA primase
VLVNPGSRTQLYQSLGRELAAVENPVERRLYVERVAQRFGLSDLAVVRAQLRRGLARGAERARPQDKGSDAHDFVRKQQDRGKLPPRQLPFRQRELLGALLDQPSLFTSEDSKNLEELLTNPELRDIFRTARSLVASHGILKAPDLLDKIPDGAGRLWLVERLSVQQCDEETAVDKLRQGLPLLAKEHIEQELPRLDRLVCEARQQGNDLQAVTLTKQRDELFRSALRVAQGV